MDACRRRFIHHRNGRATSNTRCATTLAGNRDTHHEFTGSRCDSDALELCVHNIVIRFVARSGVNADGVLVAQTRNADPRANPRPGAVRCDGCDIGKTHGCGTTGTERAGAHTHGQRVVRFNRDAAGSLDGFARSIDIGLQVVLDEMNSNRTVHRDRAACRRANGDRRDIIIAQGANSDITTGDIDSGIAGIGFDIVIDHITDQCRANTGAATHTNTTRAGIVMGNVISKHRNGAHGIDCGRNDAGGYSFLDDVDNNHAANRHATTTRPAGNGHRNDRGRAVGLDLNSAGTSGDVRAAGNGGDHSIENIVGAERGTGRGAR